MRNSGPALTPSMIKLLLLSTLHGPVSNFTHMDGLWQDLDLEILVSPKEIALPRVSGASLGPLSSPGHVPKEPTVAVVLALVGARSGQRPPPCCLQPEFFYESVFSVVEHRQRL